jgi:hypothetical protein
MGHFYSEAELTAIKALWATGKSAAKIAKLVNAEFGTERTRNAILGKAHRLNLPDHHGGAEWAAEGHAKREATMKAKGITVGRKPKPPATVAPGASEEPVPLGKPGEHAGGCQWRHGDDPKTWVCCGHDRLSGSPYCPHHSHRAYAPAHGQQPKRPHIFMNPDRQFR